MRPAFAFIISVLAAAINATAQQAPDSLYVSITDLPDVSVFLPAPSDTASMEFADDFYQWQWGVKQRTSLRGQQASDDSRYGIENMASIFGTVLNITINSENTPAIYRLLSKAARTGAQSTFSAKSHFYRKSPLQQLNQQPWGEYDTNTDTGSYPSAHAAMGWASALVLAEMYPDLQDRILSRGFEYGQSRVITGAHWQSDVDAGRLCAAAALARMHSDSQFGSDMQAAQTEYRHLIQDRNPTVAGWPQGENFLPEAVDTVSNRYYGDVIGLWHMKPERTTARGTEAVADACNTDSALLVAFAPAMGIGDISSDSVPALLRLIGEARSAFIQSATQLSATKFRKRPFVKLGGPTLLPAGEQEAATTSSFPSTDAALGWGLALILAELMPGCQNAILQRGYEYGRSSIITGYHYPSDVQAGRNLATAVVARLHASPDFTSLFQAAQAQLTPHSPEQEP